MNVYLIKAYWVGNRYEETHLVVAYTKNHAVRVLQESGKANSRYGGLDNVSAPLEITEVPTNRTSAQRVHMDDSGIWAK